ncbi:MAG: hypothetical protein BZY80_01855 [SAR202 cluster bacterium Io17-Chloro-G2]|nr:MAG: hypothetical protein BZY80_01855 [SAR202 cluster bacterium Io17-Chloro-G2]
MANESSPSQTKGQSRRNFLAKLGLGTAALALVSVPFFSWGRNKTGQATASKDGMPEEDSIFHPR